MLGYVLYTIIIRPSNVGVVSYDNYTGSIHFGFDTLPGTYQLSDSSEGVYGVEHEGQFVRFNFNNNDIVNFENGDHAIFYNTTVTPTTKTIENSKVTSDMQSLAIQSEVSIPSSDENASDMHELTSERYGVPYIVSSIGENSYIELYDDEMNSINYMQIEGETIQVITPKMGTYIKLENLDYAPIDEYVSNKGIEDGYYEAGVYIIGKSLEAANYTLHGNDNCSYRIIEDSSFIVDTELETCSGLNKKVTLEEGNILEFHNMDVMKSTNESSEVDSAT